MNLENCGSFLLGLYSRDYGWKSGNIISMKILLDEIMKTRGLSEGQVSILTGLSGSTVHEIRRGSMPRVDTVEILAKGLGIRINDLIDSPYLDK